MSKYDVFRRRIAPIAFGLAIVLLVRETCQKQERTHATVVLTYGAAEPRVMAVDAELWIGGDEISQFHRKALGGSIGTSKFETAMPQQDGELRIDVDLAPGDRRHIVRKIHAEENSTITVPLELDLR